MDGFKEILYESLLFSFGKVLAKYNTFAQGTILKEVGKEIIDYLNRYGLEFTETGSIEDLSELTNLFVKNGFADLETFPSEKGVNYKWNHLYGIRAYAALQKITDNPFLSCPLNACIYYIADKYGKTLKLHSKSFDLDADFAESEEEVVDKEIENYEGFDSLIIENKRLFEISEQQNIQLKIEEYKLREQLHQSQKMDALGQLASGVAHDFNNMLAGILGAAEMIGSNGDLCEEDSKYIDMIIQSSTRAADLTSKLLTFSRKGEFAPTSIDVHTNINDTVALLERSIDKKVRINLDMKASNYVVIGDHSQLQSSLMNICINASHAMPEGGEILISTRNLSLDKIYCKASPFDISPGEFIEIEVSDTGCGIPHENLHKIFEPFFTTKQQGKGTGLGLSAVYGIVENHHGAITVYSESGVGTVFYILLPVSEEKPDSLMSNETIIKGTGTIFLVDDDEFIRITTKALLEDMGYDVILAENGQAAVDLFEKEYRKIDLVILDMIMPVMNGREAYGKMREIDENIKAIISSGFFKPDDLTELKNSELSGSIRKPYRKVELSQLVAEILSGRRR